MEFFEARSKCVEQANATLDAICLNEQQRTVAFKVINLLLDSKLASQSGDETAEKLLLSSALVLESETFGQAAQAKWVLLNQIANLISECVDGFDSEKQEDIAQIAEESGNEASITGIIIKLVKKTRPHRFEEYRKNVLEREKKKKQLAELKSRIKGWKVKREVAGFFRCGFVTFFMFAGALKLGGREYVPWSAFWWLWLGGGFLSVVISFCIFDVSEKGSKKQTKDEHQLAVLEKEYAQKIEEFNAEFGTEDCSRRKISSMESMSLNGR